MNSSQVWQLLFASWNKTTNKITDKNYILKEFPEGYTLWEHVKYNKNKLADDKKKDKAGSSSRHAAGIYERQDAYLYGCPQGRKKRYRSPADFFPHAIWLSCDEV